MKKILILSLLVYFSALIPVKGACPIEALRNGQTSCTVVLQGQNQTIKDKLIPNNLNQMVNPSRNMSNEFKAQPHVIPETINTNTQYNNPEKDEGNTPYNSACQFGVCLPGESSGSQNGR